MRSYHDAGHLAGIAQQALALMESMSVDDRIIKTEPEEDSPMSGIPSCGPSHTNAYFSPGSSIIKTEPEEEDSPMSGIPLWEPSYTNAYFAPRPSIIKTEPEEEDSPMSGISPWEPSHTNVYFAPGGGPSTIKAEPEEDSTMSGLNGLPPINPSNPPEFGYGGFHGDDWEDWLSQRMRNYPRTQIVQQQQTPSDDDDEDQNLFASSRSLAAVPDPLPMDIKVEEEARVLDVFGNRITLSAWGLEIKAQVKDDDDDMSFLDLKTEKGFEVDSKWWQRLNCC
ncbi:hypothetical protein E4U57_006064 [Claviceps arundinis]|uniref:Uncharacterized protein n=1 Tax=Claviceps arundinis TaxID=1623583 RepID=A0A9P7MZ99_9HYPO|nr:hypothetical protein E4U57_006064 [Claviceps arundinis]KAG5974750.1 hypothetical protein E4U56_004304 [Claviceps arundinis]